MTNSPFGLPESALNRFAREERERAELFRNALAGGAIMDAARQATEQHRLLRGVDFDASYRGILDTLNRDRESRETLKHLASTAWALSVQETARSIAEQHSGVLERQHALSSTVLETVNAFDANRSALASAIAAASVGDSYRRIISDALPRMAVFGAIAERMLLIDTMTLRASEEAAQTATAIAAEMVIEAQRIAEAIAEAPTDEEADRLYSSLLDLFVNFVASLGVNTIPELQRMGLVGFVSFVITVLSAYALTPQQASQSPEDRAAFAELNKKFDRLEEHRRRYREAEVDTDEAYIANLPRAELSRKATFRSKPVRDGDVVLKAPKGTVLAVAKAQGHWRLVVFRDPLSNQLAQGWVCDTALAPLAAATSVDGE